MASEVDICNLAVGHLGERAEISSIRPPDGSALASWCARFYPMARDAFLESHNWTFATRRRTLMPRALDTMPAEWAFAYQYPTCLRLLGVMPPDVAVSTLSGAIFNADKFLCRVQERFPFRVEAALDDDGQVIYTNVEDATAYFIVQETTTTKYTPLAVVAIARLLASYLAGPVIKGEKGMTVSAKHLEFYEKVEAPRARAFNAQIGKDTSYNSFVPDAIAARR